jgi:lipopolysaccharide/colanic/teichoic acid biosynthesis glycosyltransferase
VTDIDTPEFAAAATRRRVDTAVRRAVDIGVAVVGLCVLAPLLLVVWAAVRVSSPGPGFFRQNRVGRLGRPFRIWKFRTMAAGADRTGALVSGPGDTRVTRLGRFLRPTRIDELPQLINILRGEMSLVGPRPEVERYLQYYSESERAVLAARPGVLGPGALLFVERQASELDVVDDPEQHYIRHHLHPKLALDLAYLSDRGLVTDLRLALQAVELLVGRGRRS